MNTEDRRVRKTKRALQEGLAELMMNKDLRSITVRELTDKVDIHRATFYAHYQDVYDLYEQMENAVIDELIAIVSDISLSDEAFFETLVNYVYENSKIFRMLLNQNGNRSFLDRISDLLEKKYIAIWMDEMKKDKAAKEWDFFAGYHIWGCLAIISHWVEHDFKYPKDKIVELIRKVDTNFDVLLSK